MHLYRTHAKTNISKKVAGVGMYTQCESIFYIYFCECRAIIATIYHTNNILSPSSFVIFCSRTHTPWSRIKHRMLQYVDYEIFLGPIPLYDWDGLSDFNVYFASNLLSYQDNIY